MDPRDWSRIQQGIFAGESGGDYGALFGYQNRPNGRFSGVDLTKMTVDQALDFANPSGPYGQYVKGQVGRVATPMGAYQIVGTTLRAAKEGLGLRGDEVLTPAMQDKLGQWIYKTQGTGAWEGYKPMTEGQAIAAETMSLLGKGPQTSTKGPQMMQEQKPQGLLGSLGIQRMEEGAEGETGQRFYQRDSFKDTAAVLAQGFGRMGIMGMEEIADDIAKQRTENKARNKTAEYLRKAGRGDLADMVDQGMIGGKEAAGVLLQKPEEKVRQVRGSELGLTGPQADRLFNVDADNKVTAIGGTAPVTNINMGDKLSPGLKKLDESFAETYANLSMSGLADARAQAATISTVLTKLEAGEPLTGPLIGAQPDLLRAITNPDAQDAIDRVGSVVQRSLREVLGGQFAQKEGEQLVRRAYNPSLPPAQNAARLRALFSVLDQTAKNKMDMATYYQENDYSLGGYKGNMGLPTREDLEAAMDAAAPAPQGSAQTTLSAEDQALVDKYSQPRD